MGCFIVAEAGINHMGSRTTMLLLCDAAKRAGADAVKFQAYDTDALIARRGSGDRDLLKQCELSDDDLEVIADYCLREGIKWFASVFDPSQVERVLRFGACALKIGHAEAGWHELIDTAHNKASSSVPMWISNPKFRWSPTSSAWQGVHCVCEYPATSGPRLGVIGSEAFMQPSGFSSHYTDWRIPAAAALRGASYVEAHLKLSDSDPEAAWGLSVEDFGKMVRQIREYETWL